MKICVAGQGAFGQKHLDALKRIPDVEVTSLVGGNQDATAEVAKKYGIPHYTGELSEGIKRADAVILTTPTKMHFRQGEQVMRAGKHVLVEIPVTDSVEDAEALAKVHLGRGGEDHGVGALDAFRQLAGVVRDAVLLGDLGGGVLVAADQRGDFDVRNALERVEMLLTEGALAGYADLHHRPLRMSCFM